MTVDRRAFVSGAAFAAVASAFPNYLGARTPVPTVMAHGGGIMRNPENSELRRLVRSGTMYLVPYSAADWQETYRTEEYWHNQAGFSRIKLLSIASSAEFSAGLQDAAAVWFCGGLQSLLMQNLGTVPGATDMLQQAHAAGVVMAGGSAGAAVMSKLMISGGSNGNVYTRAGLGFLPGLVLDQHVVRRHREYRLQKVIAANPQLVGVGIDEDTAVTFQGTTMKVVGKGPAIVTYVSGGEMHEQRFRGGKTFDLGKLDV